VSHQIHSLRIRMFHCVIQTALTLLVFTISLAAPHRQSRRASKHRVYHG
jgi:hypothetical protein